MFRLRVRIDCHARTKNGHPPHSTTGVASAISKRTRLWLMLIPIAEMKTGTVKTRQIQKRRRMSISSGFSPSSSDGDHRLQCHAADRTASGLVANDLRMHRAGILAWPPAGAVWIGLRSKILGGIGVEFRGASLCCRNNKSALGRSPCRPRIGLHLHPANRIFERDYFGRGLARSEPNLGRRFAPVWARGTSRARRGTSPRSLYSRNNTFARRGFRWRRRIRAAPPSRRRDLS